MGEPYYPEGSHEVFVERLVKSVPYVWRMAWWFAERKYEVRIPPTNYGATTEVWRDYSDGGDLFIRKKNDPETLIEVKSVSRPFTCRDDWPFGNRFIVTQQGSYDRKERKPYAYAAMNKARTHIGVILCSTSEHWWVENTLDSQMGRKLPFYYVNTDMVKFIELGPGPSFPEFRKP